MFPWFALATAAPPSSTLDGPAGQLVWQVQPTTDGVLVRGRSPKWRVEHTATSDLRPLRTRHDDADGQVVVTYDASGATVTRAGSSTRLEQADLWDGDTVDVRLGDEVARGRTQLKFSVVAVSLKRIYTLDSASLGEEDCAGRPCTHVRVQLVGMLRVLGPTWHYWYGDDGRLLRFEGPIGQFAWRP